MRTYNIYLDRIEITFDNCIDGPLEYKLVALSQDLLNFYYSTPLGIGKSYRHLSYLVEDLVLALDFTKHVDEAAVVGILRNSLCFLRRFKFPDFQINIINHV